MLIASMMRLIPMVARLFNILSIKMNIIITVIVAILAMAIGCVAALYFSRKNAKSQANEIIEKARLEAEVLKNKEVLKGKEIGMSIKSDAEKEANSRLSRVQTSEAKLKQREMSLNQQQGTQAPQQ